MAGVVTSYPLYVDGITKQDVNEFGSISLIT